MLRRALLLMVMANPAYGVKFWTQVIPAAAGGTTIVVNAGSIWAGIKKTPKVIAATPKGPKAIVKAAKGAKPAKGPAK